MRIGIHTIIATPFYLLLITALTIPFVVVAQNSSERICYTGTTISKPERHDGGLSPVVGVHNIQIMRANRENPSEWNGYGWTYNHQPMMAWWKGKFYVHYLSDPKDEHVPPSRTLLQTSIDGYEWTAPEVLFPEYPVPDGFTKAGRTDKAKDLMSIMHQRVGFYVSNDGETLLAIGNYGIALDKKDDPNDGNGIGRVVRQINNDGSLGQIYFIYYNHDFNEKNTIYPHYKKAPKTVRKACEEILANPRQRMQWVEEADRNDPLIPLNKGYKAYCDYTLPDGRIVCLWKHALTSISQDGGNTWAKPIERARGIVNSNAKIWGQRLSDGTYALVYNPSEFRWPLGISLSADGLNYTTLSLVNGEVPPMRYGGNYKSYGPQYVRGIQEGNGLPQDSNLWVTYSMNKEDMWVARIPVPVQFMANTHADDDFTKVAKLSELTQWNFYSPVMARVGLEDGWLTMKDADAFDYAKIERKIPESKELTVSFDFIAEQTAHGTLHIEFLDKSGTACSRLELIPGGEMRLKGGARFGRAGNYQAKKKTTLRFEISIPNRQAVVYVDGKKKSQRMLFSPVESIERVAFRTGVRRTFPDIDTPADWDGTLPDAGRREETAVYRIANFKTSSADGASKAMFLNPDNFKHYVDYFNGMEDENIVQAIPNKESWQWIKENVPLFECPNRDFEMMYYFRWWTLRKHIKETPVGYAMTEFLVNRSYADQYNLISSALGHHIMESRWLRNPMYLEQTVTTWLRGNDGKAMKKLTNYSSWTTAALWNKFKVDGRKDWLIGLKYDLEAEYNWWNDTHRLSGGLFWQADVQDAMEESISGGRKKKYARPSINAYMYGNTKALEAIMRLTGNEHGAIAYEKKADTIRSLVLDKLWDKQHLFFETLRGDTTAKVREAIGFIPWYFNLPTDNAEYGKAWLQAANPKGFSAPRGLTTAERRHPEFRTHGTGKCEWDGAVWPFATSQTLTAMANYINDYTKPTVGDSLFFAEMTKYVEAQSHRGRPYIGEYYDEVTGYWLKGDQERSRYYNHSTFCDLIITGICGLRPRTDDAIVVTPLVPDGLWDYFCLDNVAYHGKTLTIIWDKDGMRYHRGKGLQVFLDGEIVLKRETLRK